MNQNEVTFSQLFSEITQLKQQIKQLSQQLDMIYGAVTRLNASNSEPKHGSKDKPSSVTDLPFSASMMMDPGNMLNSLRQHAQNVGLTISSETVDRLKAGLPESQ